MDYMARIDRLSVDGCEILFPSLGEAVSCIVQSARVSAGRDFHLVNIPSLETMARDEAMCTALTNPDALNIADGAALSLIARVHGLRVPTIRGPDLLRATLLASERESDLRHYFLGGNDQGVLDRLQQAMARLSPTARWAGGWAPPFGPQATSAAVDVGRIHAVGANLVWVGLGTPKQDIVARALSRQGVTTVAVGAAFDYLAGLRKEAPPLLQGSGLEWGYRLAKEPRRLGSRYWAAAKCAPRIVATARKA